MQPVEHSGEDKRTVAQFSDAELTAILRRRVGVVPVETDEQRPDDATPPDMAAASGKMPKRTGASTGSYSMISSARASRLGGT